MTQWKPTKAGEYRRGADVTVWNNDGRLMARDPISHRLVPVADGPWSLVGPDWQAGAPTVAQLRKWPWWAVQWESGVIVVDCTDDAGDDYATSRALAFSKRPIARSAPVQRDATNGPLWVPMEVAECKEENG